MELLYFDDAVNCAEVSRTYSGRIVNYCGLWLVAWNVQVHDLEIEKIVECNENDCGCEPCAGTSYNEEEFVLFHREMC